jgi:NRPS condensation-like uncharacterized protein
MNSYSKKEEYSMNETFPVAEQDIFGYLAEKYTSNNQLSCVITFNSTIDDTLLKKAILISLKEQPILACRLIEGDSGLAWKHCNDLTEENYYSILETRDTAAELQKFITEPFHFEQDCQLKVGLFRGTSDILCVKIHHTCTDGGGLKQYVILLTEIYNQLVNNRQYIRQSSTSGNRSQQQILSLPIIPNAANSLELAPDTHPMLTFSDNMGKNDRQIFLTETLLPDEFALMTEYARYKGATINDVLLTAYIRALAKVGELQDDTLSVNLTVDLRRYLPNRKAETIANLSSGEFITVDQISSDTFNAALSKVLQATQKMKQNYPGVRGMLSLKYLATQQWKEADMFFRHRREQALQSKLSIPYFSNLGVISETPMAFGLAQITECYTVGQALFAPGFIMLVSTYAGSLTIAVNFYQSTTPRSVVEKLLYTMVQELRACIYM